MDEDLLYTEPEEEGPVPEDYELEDFSEDNTESAENELEGTTEEGIEEDTEEFGEPDEVNGEISEETSDEYYEETDESDEYIESNNEEYQEEYQKYNEETYEETAEEYEDDDIDDYGSDDAKEEYIKEEEDGQQNNFTEAAENPSQENIPYSPVLNVYSATTKEKVGGVWDRFTSIVACILIACILIFSCTIIINQASAQKDAEKATPTSEVITKDKGSYEKNNVIFSAEYVTPHSVRLYLNNTGDQTVYFTAKGITLTDIKGDEYCVENLDSLPPEFFGAEIEPQRVVEAVLVFDRTSNVANGTVRIENIADTWHYIWNCTVNIEP